MTESQKIETKVKTLLLKDIKLEIRHLSSTLKKQYASIAKKEKILTKLNKKLNSIKEDK